METLAASERMLAVGAAEVNAAAPAERATRTPSPLSQLRVGESGTVLRVGTAGAPLNALERRLLELGFIGGEHVEVLAEARPGRDPFVVRVGSLALALRRREAESVWVGSPAPES